MNLPQDIKLSGVARMSKPMAILEVLCDHFVEHAEVERTGDLVLLKSAVGSAAIHLQEDGLLIELNCPSEQSLQLSCNMLAEHLFYFAGDEPMELVWSRSADTGLPANFREGVVVSTEIVTPHMRRVKVRCDDVSTFVGGGMHVRLLVPRKGRTPVWPTLLPDGRTNWPTGDDELLVRVYTIRAVDHDLREVWIDFLQHPMDGIETPGADFARDAKPGDRIGFIGPGAGDVPKAANMFLAGDEAALPAIARILAEIPPSTKAHAIIEVENRFEEQSLPSSGSVSIEWLHRDAYSADGQDVFQNTVTGALSRLEGATFVWLACEKSVLRNIRPTLKKLQISREMTYAAWYWEKGTANPVAD